MGEGGGGVSRWSHGKGRWQVDGLGGGGGGRHMYWGYMGGQVGIVGWGEGEGAGGWVGISNIMVLKGDVGAVEQWGGWFLLALFGAILTWEEVWNLPNSAALSAWLLLLITAGAMICSWYALFNPHTFRF